jgi:hypothetical protein
MYKRGSLVTVSKELSKYKLDLVGVQEVRWEGGGTKQAAEYTFFYRKGNENHESYHQLRGLNLLVTGCHT